VGVKLVVISLRKVKRLRTPNLIGPFELFETHLRGEPVEPHPRGLRRRDALQAAPATEQCLAHGFVCAMRAPEHQHAVELEPGAVA